MNGHIEKDFLIWLNKQRTEQNNNKAATVSSACKTAVSQGLIEELDL